jgi:hypothetical protein
MATGTNTSGAIIIAAALISGAILAGDLFGSRYEYHSIRSETDGSQGVVLDTLTGELQNCLVTIVTRNKAEMQSSFVGFVEWSEDETEIIPSGVICL